MLSLMNHAQLQLQQPHSMTVEESYLTAMCDSPQSQHANSPQTPQRSRVCRHFLAGRCTWGDSCRFSHEPPQMMQQAGDSAAPAAIRVGVAPISSHPMPVLTGAGATTPVKKATAKAAADGATSAADEAAQRERSAAEAAGVCRHFLVGRCTWGDSCRFSHVMPNSPQRQQGAPSTPPKCAPLGPECAQQRSSSQYLSFAEPSTPPHVALVPPTLRCFEASASQVTAGEQSGATPNGEGSKFPECPPARTPTRYSHNPYAVTPPPLSLASSRTTSPATFHRGLSGVADVNTNAMQGFALEPHGTSLQLSSSYC